MYFRYLGRELRRRARSAAVVAIGLALAVGLVITVTAAASGVNAAQGQVLSSLYGVGTDLTVTKVPTAGSGGSFSFNANPSSRAEAGQAFSQDHLSSSPGLEVMADSDVTSISALKGVEGATGALVLNSIHVSGSFGSFFGGGSSSSPSATRDAHPHAGRDVDPDRRRDPDRLGDPGGLRHHQLLGGRHRPRLSRCGPAERRQHHRRGRRGPAVVRRGPAGDRWR